MPSDLQITNIRDLTNANSAISIASDGQVTIAQNNPTIQLGSNASGFTGIKEADMWYLTSGFTTDDGTSRDPITANLSRVPTSHHFEMIGSGMTEASGVFTFPQTGKYIVRFHCGLSANFDARYVSAVIDGVISGSVVSNLGKTYTSISYVQSNFTYTFAVTQCIFDCQSTSTHKVQFAIDERSANNIEVASGLGFTNMQFLRIGDT